MAELTPAQLQAVEAMIAGSHFKVDPSFAPSNTGPDVVFPSSGTGGVSRVTEEGLNVYSRPSVSVNPFTGSPIMVAADGTRRSVQTATGPANRGPGRSSEASPVMMAGQPNGSILSGKDQARLGANEYDFAYGEKSPIVAALSAIDEATVGMPRRRPNIEDNPGTIIPIRAPDTGRYGVKMSPGMSRVLGGQAGMAGVPGLGAMRSAVMRAPMMVAAPPQQARRPVMVAAPSVAPMLPNGVANPAYRDYTPSYTSEGGGVMPSSSYSGSFTDSLGGTYYDRHL
jgi:hypothetical protein